ncbi:hypothetical protein ACP70R_002034 [Stipagrostis hirtigluma subsp. patula]
MMSMQAVVADPFRQQRSVVDVGDEGDGADVEVRRGRRGSDPDVGVVVEVGAVPEARSARLPRWRGSRGRRQQEFDGSAVERADNVLYGHVASG